jgi:hypothetical protein
MKQFKKLGKIALLIFAATGDVYTFAQVVNYLMQHLQVLIR